MSSSYEHPVFAPDQQDAILDFFAEQNYAVLGDALSSADICYLNGFIDRSQREIPTEWNVGSEKVRSHTQILNANPELDRFLRLPTTFPLVDAILGPQVRFAQFDFRDVPDGYADKQPMSWHRDWGYFPDGTRLSRFASVGYLCSIVYLNDVDADAPAFGVVPNSHLAEYADHEEARSKMGSAFREVPITVQRGQG